jgi:hypothetical protein
LICHVGGIRKQNHGGQRDVFGEEKVFGVSDLVLRSHIGEDIAFDFEIAAEGGEFRSITVAHIAGEPRLTRETWNGMGVGHDKKRRQDS